MQIRTAGIVIALILSAFVGGWFLGRHVEKKITAESEMEIETVVWALSKATYTNGFYGRLDTESEERTQERRTTNLIIILYSLAMAEPYNRLDRGDVFEMQASLSLQLLGALDEDELARMVEKSNLVDELKDSFLDPTHTEHDVVTNFVQRAFKHLRASPRYPAQIWLEAVMNDDVELLKEVYSENMRNNTDDAAWAERLATDKEELESKCGACEYREFGYSYTVGMDGEVVVHWKEDEPWTFPIIKENDVWKIDEP